MTAEGPVDLHNYAGAADGLSALCLPCLLLFVFKYYLIGWVLDMNFVGGNNTLQCQKHTPLPATTVFWKCVTVLFF